MRFAIEFTLKIHRGPIDFRSSFFAPLGLFFVTIFCLFRIAFCYSLLRFFCGFFVAVFLPFWGGFSLPIFYRFRRFFSCRFFTAFEVVFGTLFLPFLSWIFPAEMPLSGWRITASFRWVKGRFIKKHFSAEPTNGVLISVEKPSYTKSDVENSVHVFYTIPLFRGVFGGTLP